MATLFTAARPEEILLPVKPWFVMVTLLVGLMANMLPLSGVALSVKPDFLALVRVVGGAPLPRWTYAVGALTGALLWPPLSVLLQRPQRPPRSPGEL